MTISRHRRHSSVKQKNELGETFARAAAVPKIVSARFAILDAAETSINAIAAQLHVGGYIMRKDRQLAAALLCRLASELIAGMAILLRKGREYPAGALLRQFVEVEYLLYGACNEPAMLERWYKATGQDLRRIFSPQSMRDASDGLFRDEEYWQHCAASGHPSPHARLLLKAYKTPVAPAAFLLPDTVQHVRRLWVSLELLLPRLYRGELILEKLSADVNTAIKKWAAIDEPAIVALHGLQHNEDFKKSASAEGARESVLEKPGEKNVA